MTREKQYTIGLDIGTNSVGWAVIDDQFKLVQGKKNINDNGNKKRSRTNLWGVRLFEEGQVAADRRSKRGLRRRIARRKERLNYLRGIFTNEILKFDDSFFIRMDESFLQPDDKQSNKFVYRDENGVLQPKKVSRDDNVKYPLFNGKPGTGETYTDEAAYYQEYPTIYHLRQRLVDNPEQADLRLVYLAMHHILKYRGHFTNQGQKIDLNNIDIAQTLKEVLEAFDDATPFQFGVKDTDQEKANQVLTNRNWASSKKASELNKLYAIDEEIIYRAGNEAAQDELEDRTEKQKENYIKTKQNQLKGLFKAIVGNMIDPKAIFANAEYDDKINEGFPKQVKYSAEDFDVKLGELASYLNDEEINVITLGKKVYEAIMLSNILTEKDLASSMVAKYDLHHQQLKELKRFARSISGDFYNELFNDNEKGEPGIYKAYVEGAGNPGNHTSRENFYKDLKKAIEGEIPGLKFPASDQEFDFENLELSEERKDYLNRISDAMKLENYLPKQRQADNGAIPYQVHEHELLAIIKNQQQYYDFLRDEVEIEEENEDGEFIKTTQNKIDALFKFRIPYYVGTLAKESNWKSENGTLTQTGTFAKNSWVVRNNDKKVTPWNFAEVINKEESAVNFIERMTNFDTYLPSEKVLPKNSLLYQEFTIYNELMIGGYMFQGKKQYFTPEQRQRIVNNLFKSKRKVTAQLMLDFLKNEYEVKLTNANELFGIDTFVKSPSYNTTYSTFIDLLKAGIDEATIDDNRDVFEQIIKWQTIFEDKKILKKTIQTANVNQWNNLLSDEQVKKLAQKHYTGWGRLSKKMLDELKTTEGMTIIQSLKEGAYKNFMRLLEDEKIVEAIKNEQTAGVSEGKLDYSVVEELAGSPALKKGIWQSLQIVKELENYLGRENVSKIVIEMSRDDQNSRRTKTRQKQIDDFYNKFKEKTGNEISQQLKAELAATDEKAFKDEAVFLYFMQNGKSMYSDKSLDLSSLSEYQVDHIVPQTYIKDDSLDNKVLVTLQDNQNKGGDTPSKDIIRDRSAFWEQLAASGQVSPRKLANLKKGDICDKEREKFINRQLVENRQITKNVANILTAYFENSDTLVLTPKSGLTHQFREGVVYLENPGFDSDKAKQDPKGYKVNKFIKREIHPEYKKNRDLNDYHHAHDAYLNAFVAQYLYIKYPELKNAWVYGEYQRGSEEAFGKFATQRKNKSLQLLSDMLDPLWKGVDPDTGEMFEFNRDDLLGEVEKTLHYRNINIVKKPELQLGKFGDESVYKADATANNFSAGLKKSLPANQYGGTKKPKSAFTVVVKDAKGVIKAVSISAVIADDYRKAEDKLVFVQKLYPKDKIVEILVSQVAKYSKYLLPSGAPRLLASYQEAQNGSELPMLEVAKLDSSDAELGHTYDVVTKFIADNELFMPAKVKLLETTVKDNFIEMDSEAKMRVLGEMLRVTKGSNQGLKNLKEAGLATTIQQLKSGNVITNGTTLINQSITGLYETRITLK
jgi:CRISPR-associated endonuclease Csn1